MLAAAPHEPRQTHETAEPREPSEPHEPCEDYVVEAVAVRMEEPSNPDAEEPLQARSMRSFG